MTQTWKTSCLQGRKSSYHVLVRQARRTYSEAYPSSRFMWFTRPIDQKRVEGVSLVLSASPNLDLHVLRRCVNKMVNWHDPAILLKDYSTPWSLCSRYRPWQSPNSWLRQAEPRHYRCLHVSVTIRQEDHYRGSLDSRDWLQGYLIWWIGSFTVAKTVT